MTKKKQKHKTPEMIKREMKLARIRKDLLNQFPELFNGEFTSERALEDLTGLQVKLNTEKYESWFERDKEKVSEVFKKWYYENVDNIFTVKGELNRDIYELDGIDGWTFSGYDLVKVQ